MSKTYTIGIDPGSSTGFAIWHRTERRIAGALTTDFWGVFEALAEYPPDVADIIVEDASLNNPTFRQKGTGHYQDRLARNVGFVQRESQLLIEGLRRAGYTVIAVRPQSAKWDAATCARFTGFNGRISQHARDAIKLCFGVNHVREEISETASF